jgi:hypothetical protein
MHEHPVTDTRGWRPVIVHYKRDVDDPLHAAYID